MKQFNNLKNSGENQNVIKRYILHFEVNNTLTLADSPNGLSKDENVLSAVFPVAAPNPGLLRLGQDRLLL